MLVFIAVMVFFSVWGETSGTFLTSANIKNVLGNQAVLGVLSLAIMIPLVCGEFDFSVGPVAGLSQVLCAGFMAQVGPAPSGSPCSSVSRSARSSASSSA